MTYFRKAVEAGVDPHLQIMLYKYQITQLNCTCHWNPPSIHPPILSKQ